MLNKDELRDLALILKSRYPIVMIETLEEQNVIHLLSRACSLDDFPFFVWNAVEGLRRYSRPEVIAQTFELEEVLRHIHHTAQNGVYALFDAQPWIDDNPLMLRYIRQIAMSFNETARTLVLVSNKISLPEEISRMSATFRPAPPSLADLRLVFREEISEWTRHYGTPPRGTQEIADLMVQQMLGMYKDDARRLIRQCLEDDGAITMKDVARVLQHKHESLADGGTIQLETSLERFENVGGQAHLKRWLELRREVFLKPETAEGIDMPRGVLLLGVQGSGKSLAAKAVAGSWNVPLLRLDFGALYNKFHGETERNLREALKTAGRMEPCVLWLDEIEKGIASDDGSGDGGVSRRVLATFLTWMNERKRRVFLVATANDISRLPPELLRKGRFDEIFFVDLPDAPTRSEIFRIHLAKRKCAPENFDLESLSNTSEGFSGAEIEQVIIAALYEARATKEPLSTNHLVEELRATRPLSRIRAEEVQALRRWAKERTVMAN
ncbi:MAG: AAA family ATPase [Betaproteobacteria bacterium]|nr:AAA family ATPase [Betaproteobacteria bacterium]